jgi:RNAse (barnase) inhibitor barstar
MFVFCVDKVNSSRYNKKMNAQKFIKKHTLDFSNCKYYSEIHQIIQKELGFPKWYGQNSDALWDLLTRFIYVPAEIKIIYKPKNKQSADLLAPVKEIAEVFKDAQKQYGEITLETDIM